MQMSVFYLPVMLNYSFLIYVMLLHKPKVHKGDTDLDILPPPPVALADMIQYSCSPSSLVKGKRSRGVSSLYKTLVRISKKEGKKIIP